MSTYLVSLLFASASIGGYSSAQFNTTVMTTYTVKAGNHFSFPRVIKWKRAPQRITWDIVFDENCDYRITKADGTIDNDQKDWNKLCGIFYTLFNTRGEAAMMGWRYNPETDLIEMAPYYHIESGRDMFPTQLSVKREEAFKLTLEIDYRSKQYRWLMEKEDTRITHEMAFTHDKRTCSFINFYFGGNQTAPQTLSCQMSMAIE